jgi:cell division protein FtsB
LTAGKGAAGGAVQRQRQSLNRREKRALARILLAVFILALLLLVFAPGYSLHSYVQVKQQREALLADNERLQQETAQLREETRLLKHDDKYLERIAREKYGMLKKNEEVYYIEPVEAVEPPPENVPEDAEL